MVKQEVTAVISEGHLKNLEETVVKKSAYVSLYRKVQINEKGKIQPCMLTHKNHSKASLCKNPLKPFGRITRLLQFNIVSATRVYQGMVPLLWAHGLLWKHTFLVSVFAS